MSTVSINAAERLHRRIATLAGWRRHALAVSLGAGAVLALPPFSALPVLLVSLGGLLWLLDGCRTWRGAAATGWSFGFGFFLAGLHWIVEAFAVGPVQYGSLGAPAVVGLAAGLALFHAAMAGATVLFAEGWRRAVGLAVLWVAAEWLRGHVLTGFPWNLLATGWLAIPAVAQVAALGGAYGLSLLTASIALLPAVRRPWALATAAALLAAAWGWGALRVPAEPMPTVAGVQLRLVQAAIAQDNKWSDALRIANLETHLKLSAAPAAVEPTLIVWPESAIPYLVEEEPSVAAAIARVVPPGGSLVAGTLRRTVEAGRTAQIWNSLVALDGTGTIVATYDKTHLVPFGEYVPLRGLVDLTKITAGTIDFSPGAGRAVLAVPGAPAFAPLICYEAIFPGAVVPEGPRPSFLMNVTNDAWFGTSIGPYQHFASARLRSIEEGLPLVRAANTGISGVVDPYGRVVAELGLGRSGVVDSPLPQALAAPPIYARAGDLPLLVVLLSLAAVAWRPRRTGKGPAARS